jgi:GGDEF domain-containing protein
LHRAAVHCYSEALRSTEQNAIELDGAQAAHFRAQMQALRERLRTDAACGRMEEVQASFEAELKGYRAQTRAQIQRLRQDVQAAAAAVESFAGAVNESEGNLESGLKRELSSLNQSAQSSDIEEVREAIRGSSAKIAASLEQMRSSNQLAIAQLKDEIRLLHGELQAARGSQTTDPAAESRQRMNLWMEELIKKDASFSVLLVVIRNLDGLQNCYSANVMGGALRGFQSRFENIVPSGIVGRWAKDQFAAILTTASSNAIQMSSEVARRLAEPFLEQEGGRAHSIVFSSRAGVMEFGPGSDLAKSQARLKQLAEALNT